MPCECEDNKKTIQEKQERWLACNSSIVAGMGMRWRNVDGDSRAEELDNIFFNSMKS